MLLALLVYIVVFGGVFVVGCVVVGLCFDPR